MPLHPHSQAYFDLLALPGDRASVAHVAALNRAHDLRKFEIDNYWKRSSYFWGLQLVAFGALALTAKGGTLYSPLVLVVSVFGALSALTGVLTARGSKFWQANWEHHVDFLEAAVEGNLHGIALVKTQIQFSVSRVNERFLETVLAGWILAFIAGIATLFWPSLLRLQPMHAAALQTAITTLCLALGGWWLVHGERSNLKDRAYRLSDLQPYT